MASDDKPPKAPLPPVVGAPRGMDDEDVDADDATLMASIDDMEAAKGDAKAASDIRAAREHAKRALAAPNERITIPPSPGSGIGTKVGIVVLLIAVAFGAFYLAKQTAPKAPAPAAPAKS